MTHKVKWLDGKRWPQCAPNPDYPDGVDLDLSGNAEKTCTVALPYPAKRCGRYLVKCPVCGASVGCTTAGRQDDPRSIKMACSLVGSA